MLSRLPQTLRLVLLGPPASGKGTQGRLIAERWGVPVTSIGEMLRAEGAAKTPLGIEADAYFSKGSLVPDRVALQVVDQWLAGNSGGPFVFDGFPRTIGQGEALEEIIGKRGTPLTAVLWLEVNQATINDRVEHRVVCQGCGRTFRVGWQVQARADACPACGAPLTIRGDDDPATLAQRMDQYREHTAPLIAFYEGRGLLRRIDASRGAEEVFAGIDSALHAPV